MAMCFKVFDKPFFKKVLVASSHEEVFGSLHKEHIATTSDRRVARVALGRDRLNQVVA